MPNGRSVLSLFLEATQLKTVCMVAAIIRDDFSIVKEQVECIGVVCRHRRRPVESVAADAPQRTFAVAADARSRAFGRKKAFRKRLSSKQSTVFPKRNNQRAFLENNKNAFSSKTNVQNKLSLRNKRKHALSPKNNKERLPDR